MCIVVLPACVSVQGCWVPWNWSCIQLWMPCGYWELNFGPLEEQQQPMLLTIEPSQYVNIFNILFK